MARFAPKRQKDIAMDHTGNLFIVTAPSGAGKSSLVSALLAQDSRVQLSVSHTTRAPRGQEQHGREYFFVSAQEFDAMVAADAFVEWAEVHNHRYGTSRKAIEERMAQGVDVILEIDYQGAAQIKGIFASAVLIFILPPSWDVLRTRLERRGEDSADVIATRLHNAAVEMAHVDAFDFVIINDLFEGALLDMKSIVHSRRLTLAAQRRTHADTFKALRLA